ncbi:sensor histidine kinase ['Paenibacillus yunnanensis' Narsing Rao et al. 2020]|uniref:sensor histidine kinase n=1 Tax=Paenibacillus tengchongensis TaxID=2608684 RepID=UPI00124BFC75|nr:sensor histidine kinase [Paenibacillus tengchongensis]
MSRRKIQVAAFTFIVILLAVYLAQNILQNRMIGTDVKKDSQGHYTATDTPPGYWGYGKILPGDIIEEINGSSAAAFSSIKAFNRIEGASTITLVRSLPDGGQERITLAVARGIGTDNLLLEFIVPFGTLLLFAGFSLFVYRRKQCDQAAVYLILFFLSTGFAYFSASSSGRADILGNTLFNVSFMLVPVFFLQFLDRYLKQYQETFVPGAWFTGFYSIGAMIVAVTLVEIFTGYNLLYFIPVHPTLPFFIFMNLYIIFKLIQKFVVKRHTPLRSLFKLTLLAHMLGFMPFILLFGVPSLFGITLLTPQVASIFLLAIPVVYLYMFTTRQLFDVDFVLSRFLYHIIIAFIPTSLITTFGFLITQHNNYSWVKWVQLFLMVYFIVTILLFTKEYADFRLRPSFNKNLYSFQGSLDRFSTRISRVMKRADLERVLEQEILSILPVRMVAFLEIDREAGFTGSRKRHSGEVPVPVMSALRGAVHKLAVGELVSVPSGLCIAMGQKGSTFHVLWLADKENRTKYNLDELGWLKTLANYSAIVYENLYLIENLIEDLEQEFQKQKGASPWVMRLIFNLSETERRRLASDLHDSALQDQLIWYRKLETVMLDHTIEPDLYRELESVREGLLDVIHQIRETCNEMRPPLLKEMGIVEALGQLFEQAQIRSNYVIDFQTSHHITGLSDEQTLALFRIVQELLRNASKHAKATVVEIGLEQQRDSIRLVYKDNGVGMELHELNDSYQHMGLSGIKERVRSLEGDIAFQSAVGEGLEVCITLPLESPSTTIEGRDDWNDKNLAG